MLMNCGARSHVCGGLWAVDSIACHAVCSHLASGRLGPGLQPQPAWGVSARLHEFVSLPENARGGRKKKLFVQREMSVNQLMELSVEVWVLFSLQLLELREPACNSDGTWQVEFPLVVPRKEQKNWTWTTKTWKHAISLLAYICIHKCCN